MATDRPTKPPTSIRDLPSRRTGAPAGTSVNTMTAHTANSAAGTPSVQRTDGTAASTSPAVAEPTIAPNDSAPTR